MASRTAVKPSTPRSSGGTSTKAVTKPSAKKGGASMSAAGKGGGKAAASSSSSSSGEGGAGMERRSSIKKSTTPNKDDNSNGSHSSNGKHVEFSSENQVFYDEKPKSSELNDESQEPLVNGKHHEHHGTGDSGLADMRAVRMDLENQLKDLESLNADDEGARERLDDINASARSGQSAIQRTGEELAHYRNNVQGLMELTARLREVIAEKFLNVDFRTQLGPSDSITDEEEVEARRERISRIATLREQATRVSVELAHLEQANVDLEVAVLEAMSETDEMAKNVLHVERKEERNGADGETTDDESEEKAREREREEREAEERQRREAEERRRAEEEAEERRRQEEEKRRVEEERRQKDDERKKRERDELLKNMTTFVYSVEPGSSDIGLGCVVRFMGQVLGDQDELRVERMHAHEDGLLHLEPNEELVSNIIKITSHTGSLKFDPPIWVAMPHCHPKSSTSREAVIKRRTENGQWVELMSRDTVIEDIKDYRFAEADVSVDGAEIVLMTVTRAKRDKAVISKRNTKITSSVDGRISVTFKPEKSTGNVVLEVHPFDSSQLSEMRHRYPDETKRLLSNSPVVLITVDHAALTKSAQVQLPLPQSTQKKSARPGTALGGGGAADVTSSEGGGSSARRRPMTAAARKTEEDPHDAIHVLQKTVGLWQVRADAAVTEIKSKDLVNVEMKIEKNSRLMVLRTEHGLTNSQIEKVAETLELSSRQKTTHVIMRKRATDERDVVIYCVLASKLERLMRALDEEGYTKGPSPSNELIMREGQLVKIKFSGNVRQAEGQGRDLKMVFLSQMNTRKTFKVEEVDGFGQKGLECFRGRVRLVTPGKAPGSSTTASTKEGEKGKTGGSNTTSKSQQQQQQQLLQYQQDEENVLCELALSIPKPENDIRAVNNKAQVQLKLQGVVTEALLRQLAAEMDEEWKKLAMLLGVRNRRLQDIIRTKGDSSLESVVYEMLMTWIKNEQRSTDKASILMTALKQCGRGDLALLVDGRQQSDSSRQGSHRYVRGDEGEGSAGEQEEEVFK